MKKIVSALALGAIVLGAASADTKLNINYRNGTDVYKYTNDGEGNKTKSALNQTGYNGGKDSVTISASGDVFSTKWILQPTVASDTIVFNQMELAVKLGDFHAMYGWWRDGSANGNIRVKNDVDAGNWEGKYFEAFKPGSVFKNRPNTFVVDMTNMSISDTLITGIADYTIKTDAVNVKVLGSVMTDRAAQKISADGAYDAVQQNAGAYSWGVNVNAALPGIADIEVLAKGSPKWNAKKNADGDYAGAYTFGAFFMPKMVSGLSAAVGGSMAMIDGEVSDIAFDLRARYVAGNLTLTTFNNFSVVKTTDTGADLTATSDVEIGNNLGMIKTLKATSALWDLVECRYKLNSTLTVGGIVSQLTVLGAEADKTNDTGTTIRVTPFAQIYANSGSSILVGVSAGFAGLGADEAANKNVDCSVEIPVLFRVKM